MKAEARPHTLRRAHAHSTTLLIIAGILLSLAAGLFVVQNAQGSARSTMQTTAMPDTQQQVSGTIPPAPTPPGPSNLIAYMPLIFNEPNAVVPPDIEP